MKRKVDIFGVLIAMVLITAGAGIVFALGLIISLDPMFWLWLFVIAIVYVVIAAIIT